MNYNEEAKNKIILLQPKMDEVRTLADMMKNNVNMLNKQFYLEIEDCLSQCYDILLEGFLSLDGIKEIAEAITLLAIKEKYKDGKSPNADVLKAETISNMTDVITATNLAESWYKIVKNYLQTVRSHLYAITGREEGEQDE